MNNVTSYSDAPTDKDAVTKERLDSVNGILRNERPFGWLTEECDGSSRICIALEHQPSTGTVEVDDHVLEWDVSRAGSHTSCEAHTTVLQTKSAIETDSIL